MNVNQELKVLLKEYNGILPLSSEINDILCNLIPLITVKTLKTGAHNPLGLLKMRGNLKKEGKQVCAPIGV